MGLGKLEERCGPADWKILNEKLEKAGASLQFLRVLHKEDHKHLVEVLKEMGFSLIRSLVLISYLSAYWYGPEEFTEAELAQKRAEKAAEKQAKAAAAAAAPAPKAAPKAAPKPAEKKEKPKKPTNERGAANDDDKSDGELGFPM